jgi:hypothetical protein
VKKIIAMDEDIAQCSNSAAFAISVATVRAQNDCGLYLVAHKSRKFSSGT